jgi:hypothetical protein
MRSGQPKKKKSETNNEVQGPITKISNDEFEKKIIFIIKDKKKGTYIECGS